MITLDELGMVQKSRDWGNTFELSKFLKSPCKEDFKFSIFPKVLPEIEPRQKPN